MSEDEKKHNNAEVLAILADALQGAFANHFMSQEHASAVFKHNLRELGFDSPKKVLEKPIVVK